MGQPEATGDLISLEEAACKAGYRSASGLRAAARRGRLQVFRVSPRVVMTTSEWLGDYEATLAGKGGRPRGTTSPSRKSAAALSAPPHETLEAYPGVTSLDQLQKWLAHCASPSEARELLTLLKAAAVDVDVALELLWLSRGA